MSDSKIKQILLRVSEDEKKQIEQMAKDNKMSVTAFIKIECYQMIYQKAI